MLHSELWVYLTRMYQRCFVEADREILQRMVQSPTTGNIHITFSHGEGLYDYQGKTFTRIAGAPTGMGFRDGLFLQMIFLWLKGIEFLDSRTLIVADSLSNRLRVLDLDTNSSSSICTGAMGHVDGNLMSCWLYLPYSITLIQDTLYVGQAGRIRAIKGKIYHLSKFVTYYCAHYVLTERSH